ncbi:MAG TPA: hypothetical protein VK794_17525 [Steroidobacteraceae bacterium]|jgi:hypothetical protein|nr:hypothetical protein [Steroidobacteraceae bacterium]
MHASLAFVNGAGNKLGAGKRRGPGDPQGLNLLNVLLSGATAESPRHAGKESPRPSLDKGKSKDERQADEEGKAETVSKPGGFPNDPDDPRNPNEVRERHLKKINP